MFDVGRDQDTICALSTAAGHGGISVIRVSGSRSAEIVRKTCGFLPQELISHTIHFGTLKEVGEPEPIDEVLVSYFKEGRSYTGEETFEISCHGSGAVSQMILDELIKAGGRTAERGEFTFRAFMNGRIDLVQAEGVLSLVESQSKPAARLALRQLKGRLSGKFEEIEAGIVWLLSRLEVSLDFSGEDIDVAPKGALLAKISEVESACTHLASTYDQGRILKEGLQVALAGRPNVGKSSLLNALLGEDRAIVTEIAGTTRDTIEGRIRVSGLPVTLVDTAGIRNSQDPIEKIGIERTKKSMEQADHVFFVVEAAEPLTDEDEKLLTEIPRDKVLVIANKSDLISDNDKSPAAAALRAREMNVIEASAKTGAGLDQISLHLKKAVGRSLVEDSDVVVQTRHFNLLKKLAGRIENAKKNISGGISEEFSAQELRIALTHVHEILGTEIDEQVIDRIFGDFCIGK